MLIISQLIISAKISVLKSTNKYPNYWIASFNFKHFKLNTPGIESSLPTLTSNVSHLEAFNGKSLLSFTHVKNLAITLNTSFPRCISKPSRIPICFYFQINLESNYSLPSPLLPPWSKKPSSLAQTSSIMFQHIFLFLLFPAFHLFSTQSDTSKYKSNYDAVLLTVLQWHPILFSKIQCTQNVHVMALTSLTSNSISPLIFCLGHKLVHFTYSTYWNSLPQIISLANFLQFFQNADQT